MNKVLVAIVFSVVLGVAAAAPKKPAPQPVVLAGTVTRVVDGDTLWLKTEADGAPRVVRIEGIDAPESCQVGGAEATAALTEMALGRSVTVRVAATDDHGRAVGHVFDGDKSLGDRMVRDGHAWSARYRSERGPYMAQERMALALKRGLHASPGAIQPREFRQTHGPCEGAKPKPPGS